MQFRRRKAAYGPGGYARFIDCSFEKTFIERADVGRIFGREVLRRRLGTGIDLRLQRLPSGPGYTYLEDAVARARVALGAWEDLEAKKQAQSVLTVLEEDVAAGQHQLRIRVDDFARASSHALGQLLDAASSS